MIKSTVLFILTFLVISLNFRRKSLHNNLLVV